MATATKHDLHGELIALAEVTHRRHIERDDGERCFNLFTFLEDLEGELHSKLAASYGTGDLIGRFQLDAPAIARYLWCHMALKRGDRPDGDTFRGMPILD